MSPVKTQSTPWWMWLLGGCGCLALLGVLAIVGLGFAGARWVKDTTELMNDPAKLDEAVRARFGLEELPAPWRARALFSIPLLGDVITLSSERATGSLKLEDPLPEPRELLVFASLRELGDQRERWREALGRGTDPRATGVQLPIDLGAKEAFAKGSFGHNAADVTWAAYDGSVELGGQPIPALTAGALIECPGQRRLELVLWAVARDSIAPSEPGDVVAGLPGDENALRALLELFPVC